MKNISVFIPTKDRPALFDLLLFTLKKYIKYPIQIYSYRYATELVYEKYYQDIEKRYNVKTLVQKIPNEKHYLTYLKHISLNSDYIITLTDDVLFYKEVDLQRIIEALESNKDSLAYSFRLSQNLVESKSLEKELIFIKSLSNNFYAYNYTPIIHHFNTLNFDEKGSIAHYTYPFELTASIYKVDFFKSILDTLENFYSLHEIEFVGRRKTLQLYPNNCILIDKYAQAFSISWYGCVNNDKLIEPDEFGYLNKVKLKSCNFDLSSIENLNIVEDINKDCFLVPENVDFELFNNIKSIIENRTDE